MNNDRTIADKLQGDRLLLSVEFFPPKTEEGARQILKTAQLLKPYQPDFVSITYGAGGSTRERTLDYGELLQSLFQYEVMPHLTCVGHSREELNHILERFQKSGFRHIMALRGDPPKGETAFRPHPDGLAYASELVAFIRKRFPSFCLGVGGYPEIHPEATSPEDDLRHLKHKVDQGADFITTQLFFNNQDFFTFEQRCRDVGITVPLVPGILPALSLDQVKRFAGFCGARLPAELIDRLEAVGDNEAAAAQVGVDWAHQQIVELANHGCRGIHLYILNRHHSALALFDRLKNLR